MSTEPLQPKAPGAWRARAPGLLLLVGFVAFSWVTWRWLSQNHVLYVYDPSDHLNEAVLLGRSPLGYFRTLSQYWPPLYHALLAVALYLSGDELRAAIAAVNLGVVALLAWSTFRIGELLHSAAAGAIAAGILLCYPGVFIHARHPMLDTSLAAITAVTLLAIMRCERFETMGCSVLVGALGGLGMLTKQAFLPAVLLPALRGVLQIRSRRAALHAAAAVLIAAVLALPFYAPRLSFYGGSWRQVTVAHAAIRGDLGPETQFGIVALQIGVWHQTSLGLALAWLAALPGFLRARGRAWLVLWWLSTLAFATWIPLHDTRYLFPALPALALMTAIGLLRTRAAALTITATLAFGVVQLWAVSFDSAWWPAGVAVSNGVHPAEPFQLFTRRFNLLGRPAPDPEGLGVADGLSSLTGEVGVFGDRIVRDALISRHVALRNPPRVTSILLLDSCLDPRLAGLSYVVWQVGGPLPPGHPASPAACLPRFGEVARLKVTSPYYFLGVTELVILAPRGP